MIAYALRADFEGTVTQNIDGEDREVPLFLGGLINIGDADLDLREELDKGNGVIVVDDADPRVSVALDAQPALKRVEVPAGRDPAAGYQARTATALREEAKSRGIEGASSAPKPALVTALEEHDRRRDAGVEAVAELGTPLTLTALVAAATPDGDGSSGSSDAQPPGDRARTLALAGELARLERHRWPALADQARAEGLVNLLEPNIYGLWGGKQTAKGAPNNAPGKRYVQVAGDFSIARDDGQEAFSDLTKYGDRTDWVNSLVGNGEPGVESTPTELAHLLWLFHGAETVTAVTGPPAASKHSFVPQSGRGHWATFVRRVGQSLIQRQVFADSLISRVQIEGSTANKAVRITPRILSLLNPGAIPNPNADPAAALPADDPFRYTDGSGTFTIDGVAIPAQSQFTFVADEDLTPVYGDDVVPVDLAQGTPVVTIGVTLVLEALALAQYNKIVYGTAAPAAGAAPLKTIPALGSYTFNLQQRDVAGALNGRRFVLNIPGVKWAIPPAPGPNPAGGATEIALAGEMRPLPATPAYTIDVYTAAADVAFTA